MPAGGADVDGRFALRDEFPGRRRSVARLKEEEGPEIQVHGSRLIQTLIEHGLVDEYRLWIFPLVPE